jgi:hypothetical protein
VSKLWKRIKIGKIKIDLYNTKSKKISNCRNSYKEELIKYLIVIVFTKRKQYSFAATDHRAAPVNCAPSCLDCVGCGNSNNASASSLSANEALSKTPLNKSSRPTTATGNRSRSNKPVVFYITP